MCGEFCRMRRYKSHILYSHLYYLVKRHQEKSKWDDISQGEKINRMTPNGCWSIKTNLYQIETRFYTLQTTCASVFCSCLPVLWVLVVSLQTWCQSSRRDSCLKIWLMTLCNTRNIPAGCFYPDSIRITDKIFFFDNITACARESDVDLHHLLQFCFKKLGFVVYCISM